jgi:hypothetical protein
MRNLNSIPWENGRESGNTLFRNFQNTVFDINHADQKYLKKTHFLTQLDDI